MNKINFLAKDNFPLSSDTMDMMQKMIQLNSKFALLGGTTYILSGCADDGNGNVSEGFIVINGEILPFEAGTKKTKITILQTSKSLTAFGVDYPESYVYRIAKFADNGEYSWSDFVQILTNKELEEKFITLRGDPPGKKIDWTGRIDRIPDNYMLADGRVLKTADYPDLAWSYGKENEESFTLPDLRKMFIVGYDSAAADYDSIGKTGGEEKVTLSIEEMPNHSHEIKFVDEKWGDNANSRPFPNPAGASGYSANTTSVGGGQSHENRPPFYVLAFLIKVKY